MSNLIPQPMTSDQLADILADMADRVRRGDSAEGHIEYLLPDEPGPDVLVSGAYRVGNLAGQGGLRMIGTVPGV